MTALLDHRRPSLQTASHVPGRVSFRTLFPTALVFLPIAVLYFYFVTGGAWRFTHEHVGFYDMLGEAFAAGQLHLTVEPSPGMLALDNPYDPRLNANYRLHDASFYNGKYYLYWGPFPGLVHAVWLKATGHMLDQDIVQFIGMVFTCAGFWLILSEARRRYLPAVSSAIVLILTIQFALSPTMLYLVGRPIHYHEAPIFGMALLMFSWLCFFKSLEEGRTPYRDLILSGTFVGLAVASRTPLFVYAFGPAYVIGMDLLKGGLRGPGVLRSTFLRLFAFGAPIAAIGLLLMLYNFLRFGSVAEFGLAYSLQGSDVFYDAVRNPDGTLGSFFALSNLPKGLAFYFLMKPELTLYAPYLGDSVVIPRGIERLFSSSYMFIEPPLISVLLIAPVMIFGPLVLSAKIWRQVEAIQPSGVRPVKGLALSCLLGSVLTLLLLSAGRGITMRYTADLIPGLTVSGSLMFMLLVDVLNRSAMNQGRARLYATLSRVLSGLATACTVPVIIAGLIYGLMVWRLIYPPQVLDIYLAIDESIARTRTTIAPGRIQSVNKPCGGTTWRTPGGSYLKDATVYLRAPSQRATLVAVLTSTPDLKPGTEMTVTVDGQTVLRQQLSNGQQVIATPPLQNLGGGQIVPIKFELSGADASPPHTPLPIVVSGLTLTTEDSAKAAQTIADWRGACGV